MNRFSILLDKLTLTHVQVMALIVIVLCGATLIVSLQGTAGSLVGFEPTALPTLSSDKEIGGWAALDQDSYFLGEHANARIRILYREDQISPDFAAFKRNLGFLPFDQMGINESLEDIGSGVSEYIIDYKLHIIGARKPGNYPMNPAILSYSRKQEPGSNLHTLRIARPDVQIGSLYPWNAANIPLRGIREQVLNQNNMRQSVMVAGGTALLMLAIFTGWRFGRRRQRSELTEHERLWHEFRELSPERMGNRPYLLACERIFSRLLQLQISMDPEMFWSGATTDNASWSVTVVAAREILRRVYQSGDMADTDVQHMHSLLADKLSLAVEQQRLELEIQPSFKDRVIRQPGVAWSAGVILGMSLLMWTLAAWPDLWLAPEIKQYNDTVTRIRAAHTYDENLLQDLQAFAGSALLEKVRAAALYNTATVRAGHSFGGIPPEARTMVQGLLFQAESADALMQTLLLTEVSSSEEDAIMMFINAGERLLQSELELHAASRFIENDEDILRNLELITRWRHVILVRLVQLRELLKAGHSEESEDEVISDQGLVNVIDASLPEEYEDAEMVKDNSSYIIFERF